MHKYFNKRRRERKKSGEFYSQKQIEPFGLDILATIFRVLQLLRHGISYSFSSFLAKFWQQKTSCFHFKANFQLKETKFKHLPLLQTLLSSSSGPLESLSSSCRCKWLCWLKWWWFRARLWCKWCKWLLLLLAADALKSRGFSGDGERPPFSTRSRKCSAAPTLAAPPPPKMSVIMKRDRDGRTAIDPLCIGTVIVKPLAAAATPFGDKKSAVLVIVADFGLSPVKCHWSTILTRWKHRPKMKYSTTLEQLALSSYDSNLLLCATLWWAKHTKYCCTFTRKKIVLFLRLLSSKIGINYFHAKATNSKFN